MTFHKLTSMSLRPSILLQILSETQTARIKWPWSFKQRVQNVKEAFPIKVLWSPWRLSRTGLRVQRLTLITPMYPTTAHPDQPRDQPSWQNAAHSLHYTSSQEAKYMYKTLSDLKGFLEAASNNTDPHAVNYYTRNPWLWLVVYSLSKLWTVKHSF